MSKDSDENSSNDPIEELKSILNDVEQKGTEISEKGREITGKGQDFVDIARATKGVVQYLPSQAIENLIADWRPFAQQSGRLLTGLQASFEFNVMSDTDTFAGTATLSSTGTFSNFNVHLTPDFVVKHPEAKLAINNLYAVAGRLADVSQVENLLRASGFDKASKGKKSPLELFQTAHAAFDKPVIQTQPVSTSLIPIRECIHIVIADLLKRRPKQEKTGSDYAKVMSIGEHLKRDTIPMETIESLARQWHEEIRDKELSAAKEEDIQREEWLRRLQRSTLFLLSLLSSLDPSKIRSY